MPAPDRTDDVAPHGPTLNHLRHAVAGPVVLCEPDSPDRAARVIAAWHVVDTYLRPGAQLVVLGAPHWWPDPRITQLVRSLALANVWLHEPPDASVRAAFSAASAVYVALDERGVAVVAAGPSAPGAIALPVGAGATLLAEAIHEAIQEATRDASPRGGS